MGEDVGVSNPVKTCKTGRSGRWLWINSHFSAPATDALQQMQLV